MPDSRAAARADIADAPDFLAERAASDDAPAWAQTPLDHLNFHFRQQGLGFGQDHRYAYDEETLAARLRAAGFRDIRSRPFDPAQDSRPGTLYLVGTKR